MPRGDGPASGPVRWMVLCSPEDPSGPWAWAGLRQRGLDDIRLISVDALAYSTSLTHRVAASGATAVEIAGPDGTLIGPDLLGTLNRTGLLPVQHLCRADAADREYAIQELYALFTSILHALPGTVVNRAGPRGLSGPVLRDTDWAATAGSCGLAVEHRRWPSGPDDLTAGPRQRLFVVGSAVVPTGLPAPTDVADGCRTLADHHGVELLGVDFCVDGGHWLFSTADSTPDLRPGGEPLLDALAAVLQR